MALAVRVKFNQRGRCLTAIMYSKLNWHGETEKNFKWKDLLVK
jgi:hypothetical protein